MNKINIELSSSEASIVMGYIAAHPQHYNKEVSETLDKIFNQIDKQQKEIKRLA